ncbi:uncharacterized protein LOC124172679 [Ischnura elegans]|uniref:uncharacterized protein LOC124172679 n=1 Tax=Ischnura elegans TaxID=197161 RepID=UPI001ED86BA9|nr:uncharacterized protein LOC124172679 [Ischnura elegans]
MLFILGPMVAEIIHNSLEKLPDDRETWKEVFSLQSLRLLPRAWRSVMYATITRREFDNDLCEFYEELNRWRGVPFEKLSEDPSRSEISSINAHYFAMMVENERELDQWRVHEALYESAPQLLLQLVIANMQLVNGETVGPFTIIGILVSLTYFSWTLHLYHYRQHYNGLENNFKVLDRAIDFLVHFLIVGCRSIAVSSVMALCPVWFLVVAFFYLPLRYIYFYCCSPDRSEYRKLTTGNYQILWMVHSLFITPYRLNVWCLNSYDDLLYHMETFALALYWPFLLDGGHPLADYRWIITATTLILNFTVLPLLLKWNEVMIKPSPFCDKHDPFLLRRRFWKDLKAGKTAVERLFGRITGALRQASNGVDQQTTRANNDLKNVA